MHLIHVIQVPVTSTEIVMTDYLYQQMVDSAIVSLRDLQADLIKRTAHRIRIVTSLSMGGIAARLGELCKQVKPYAIVVGTSGPTLEKFLVGSPVTSLLQNLHYPILVVPETAVFHHFRQILLACDLGDIGSGIPHSLPLLKNLRLHFGSRFDIVTVQTSSALTGENKVLLSDGWKDQLKDLYPQIHYIRMHKVEDGILEYLRHHQADLIMVFP